MELAYSLAPIAVFAFNRPDHLRKTLSALRENELASESVVFIYCDGPRTGNEFDIGLVQKVREVAEDTKGFKEVYIISSPVNKGLANSIIDGVSNLINRFGKIIVLEDDLVTSKYFLKYMNDGLEKFQTNDEIISIHGYVYPLSKPMPSPFFLKGADCWGWATWKRGWELFNMNGSELLEQLERKKLCYKFDFNGSYAYTQMLKDQIVGKNNSWAIRWYASAFLADKLTLYPNVSLVYNIGLDNSGTNCLSVDTFDVSLAESSVVIPDPPYFESKEGFKKVRLFFLADTSFLRRFFFKIIKKIID